MKGTVRLLVAAVGIAAGLGIAVGSASAGPCCEGGPTNTDPPSISSDPYVGEALTASPGTWQAILPPITYAYSWLRCEPQAAVDCETIAGASSQTYAPTPADIGLALVVEVRATQADGTFSSARSAATVPVAYARTTTPPINFDTLLDLLVGEGTGVPDTVGNPGFTGSESAGAGTGPPSTQDILQCLPGDVYLEHLPFFGGDSTGAIPGYPTAGIAVATFLQTPFLPPMSPVSFVSGVPNGSDAIYTATVTGAVLAFATLNQGSAGWYVTKFAACSDFYTP